MFNLPAIYEADRIIHVAFASVGLASLSVPLIAKKGALLHRRAGWVFVVAMTVAAVSGMVIAASWVFAPLEVKPARADWTPDQVVEHVRRLRVFGTFLAFVGLLLMNSLQSGIGALVRKKSPHATPQDKRLRFTALPTMLALAGAALLVFGVLEREILFLFFGVIGVFGGVGELRFVLRPLPSRMAWWYRHMSGMMTAVIGGLSAFLVFNAPRIYGGELPASLRFVPWILPTIAGIPALTIWVRYYRQKFEGRSES